MPSPSKVFPIAADLAPIGNRPPGLQANELISLYRDMARVRAFEEQVVEAFRAGLVPGSTHPAIGQEAIKVGAIAATTDRDLVLATYRGHAEALLKGVDPVGIMSELMGRRSGINGGKGGSMHLADPAHGLITTNAIVAGHIPHAGGVALSCKFRKTGQVVLCFFGDGAACEGEFFETLNMSMLWKVPLILICENNGYAISVPTEKSQATADIADRARGFGMPANVIDGNDVLGVRFTVGECVARARLGEGPSFIECKTLRWEYHSGFSSGAKGGEERKAARERVDPIRRYRRSLTAWGIATDQSLDDIEAEERRWVQTIRSQAEQAPATGAESIWDDIYSNPEARPGPNV
jgi:TPP-dependent pyruvate/acetoin dehydrogenase alpha subunit